MRFLGRQQHLLSTVYTTMSSGQHVTFVGKSKLQQTPPSQMGPSWSGGVMPLDSGALPRATAPGRALTNSTAEQLYFQLKEFEEFRSPSFNVLYVQTPKPALKGVPWMAELGELVAETAEFVAPLTRLFIPSNSLRDKLPYFREDYSPLPNTVRPRVQKVLRSNIQYAEQLAVASKEAAEEWALMKKQRMDARRAASANPQVLSKHLDVLRDTWNATASHEGRGGHGGASHGPHVHTYGPHIQIPHPHFYTHEMPAWVIPALNFAAYWYLCGLGSLDLFKR